ncbi:MAG: hypothetical protein HY079_01515 [Elusimicrobia bacterium]|nr:hypothetical protein [Elusimicrobiota bacterium]
MFRRSTLAASVLTLCLSVPAFAADPAPADVQSQLADLKSRLEKLEGAPAKASLSAFNPAMGAAVDFTAHDANDKANLDFRALEVNLEAPVDPYLKAWGVITGSNGGVDVEEATVETTALPGNLTARGGRLFASFGRLAHFHDHELPVIDRPKSLDDFIGGETKADGAEVSWLLPTDLFLTATVGAYDKLGADNKRQDPAGSRALDEFTYLGRLNTYFDLGDAHSLEVGVDSAWTPKRAVVPTAGGDSLHRDTWRTLSGVDLTYRYQPSSGGIYKGVVWGTEILQNDERRIDAATNLPTRRTVAYAGCSFVEVKSGRRWRGGAMVDLTEDQDDGRRLTKTVTPFLTYDVTEFQRLRATVSESWTNAPGPKTHAVGLQWTAVFGNHVHGFRDR